MSVSLNASLTVNLAKCEFGQATITYLGKEVGQGQVRPLEAKVTPLPDFLLQLLDENFADFLAWLVTIVAFCKNFSTIVQPLTSLLSPSRQFLWSMNSICFNLIKTLMCSGSCLGGT